MPAVPLHYLSGLTAPFARPTGTVVAGVFRDILFLCWSHFARQSKWVNAEWRYAFEKKGIDSIEPVPIESPAVCPPEELRKKHFNDKLLYIINA